MPVLQLYNKFLYSFLEKNGRENVALTKIDGEGYILSFLDPQEGALY